MKHIIRLPPSEQYLWASSHAEAEHTLHRLAQQVNGGQPARDLAHAAQLVGRHTRAVAMGINGPDGTMTSAITLKPLPVVRREG